MKKTSIIYLLGAGRSGTTLLATVLNSHPKITTVGEMHQFFEHLENGKHCSCGAKLNDCIYWGKILSELSFESEQIINNSRFLEKKESHSKIVRYLFNKKENTQYSIIQEGVFKAIKKYSETEWSLDSSKYIARYLLLKQNRNLNVKGIYLVRDVRGVINSFGKQVQTKKSPLSTTLYYWYINFFGQVTCWLDKGVLKIKYEDFMLNPEKVAKTIYKHIFENEEQVDLPNSFEMPHIIGGNRMKSKSSIVIKSDESWKHNISKKKQLLYYLLTFPLMVLNNYKI